MRPAKGTGRGASGSAKGQSGVPLAEPRRMMILEWVQEEGSARVRDLAQAFKVSEATIRHDLERLEKSGQISREHGGAFLKTMPQQVKSMTLQSSTNMVEKRKIGQLAATMVADGDSIIIDSGSTTTEFAHCISDRNALNVITNALNIALLLGAIPSNTIHMPGGQFKAPTLSLSGERSGKYFEGLFAQRLFLATAGLSFDSGLTYPAIGDTYVKNAMIAAASEVVLLADSSKIGRVSFSSLGSLERVDILITDSNISDEHVVQFENMGLKVMVAV